MQIQARRYDNLEPVELTIAGEQIERISPLGAAGERLDLPYVSPPFFDHQINGYDGVWFSDEELTAEAAIATGAAHYQFGVTRLFPTLITNSFAALSQGFAALRSACEQDAATDRMFPGFHLEGPYLSGEDGPRGAHPKDQIRPADWEEFQRLQEAAGGRILLVTIAPEVEGAIDFIERAVESSLVVSIGHTAASPEQIRAAVDAGARMSTHLGNGAHGTLRRHPNYIWEQLGDARLAAGVISDGHHLPPSVLRTIVAAKGVENTLITCDASGLAGRPPGRYEFESVEVEVLERGPIVIAGQSQILAGSGVQTDVCVAFILRVTDVSLAQAIDMAGRYPARLFELDEIRLRRGSAADLMVFRYPERGGDLTIEQTIAAGQVRYDGR
ncbi:MAG: amidohydrolase family protein [Pirellulaceae bacterium]|jgi:N-acetylglucosamine-6-phosphate deacetylase|nr:amidohydrolase family protein [Pirellulaceae bacterium]MDP7016381.1 amidohydrolase family protein [Pirellulaceae bacterium]